MRSGMRELGAKRNGSARSHEDEQARPTFHCLDTCSSDTRSPSPAEPVPASGGATAQSCTSTSCPAVVLLAGLDFEDQRFDAIGVELRARALAQLFERGLLREGTPVRASGGHGVERVGHVDDGRLDQSAAFDRCVGGLGGGVARDRGEEIDAAKQFDRHDFVALDPLELGFGELARLVEDLVRHDQLADVVHERRVPEPLHPPRAEGETAADVLREGGDSVRVPRRVLVLRLERQDQRLDRLLLARPQFEIAGEGATRDQDRHDDERMTAAPNWRYTWPSPKPSTAKG